ncbi:MAG: TIGR03663 family protein [Anaerolineaceae bacterium]|jgi:predicted membrane-bound mannosyltransferase/sugar lactone lactonase YvrE|nr:TIGR03663 family protein [Anaerolineaceae bacterium]
MTEQEKTTTWLDRPLASLLPRWNVETLLALVLIVLAVVSRLYDLDARVMSHDEVNHVVPSWEYFRGNGYRHDPVTHGPLQFHMLAFSYFMFGDNDFSSRIPAAVCSIAAVVFVLFAYRRYLGRAGALIGGLLFAISPFMLFYGRYTRNEGILELIGVVTLYAVLRYLDKGDKFSLFLLTATTALNFTSKETAYIYTAQLLIFIFVLLLLDLAKTSWKDSIKRDRFLFLMLIVLLLIGLAVGFAAWHASLPEVVPAETSMDAVGTAASSSWAEYVAIGCLGLAVLATLFSLVFLVGGLGWEKIREQRSFDLLILLGTLVLPLLAAFPAKMVGWDPLDYSAAGMLKTSIFIVIFTAIAAAVGLWWRPKLWLKSFALFYGIFVVFYTSFFTHGMGFFTGLVGSLGYWLSQQSVERGSQPLYYYALVQLPVYEYLAVLGTLLAVYFGIRFKRFSTFAGVSPASDEAVEAAAVEEGAEKPYRVPTLALLVYWSVLSLVAYSFAGERMPWLTVHIALPLLLAGAWGLGYLVDKAPWQKIAGKRSLIALALLPVMVVTFLITVGSLMGANPPFQGNTQMDLERTATFLLSLFGFLGSGAGIVYLVLQEGDSSRINRVEVVGYVVLMVCLILGAVFVDSLAMVFVSLAVLVSLGQFIYVMIQTKTFAMGSSFAALVFFLLLTILTARTAYTAAFINYDNAKEYLVYAHAARGPKEVLEQVEEISRRTTGGLDVMVAYDNDALYPYWWYFRNYPNHLWYQANPTRDLQNYPLIVAGESTYSKLEPIVKDNYLVFDYMRLWWPNQDYFDLNWEKIKTFFTDPLMREAVFDIWMDRDYSLYAQVTGRTDLTLETWQPSSRMKFYVRKDVASQIWDYGAAPTAGLILEADPYEQAYISSLLPDVSIEDLAGNPGALQAPRGMDIAADGSIYVADSRNHRIQHYAPDGSLLNSWGSFADRMGGEAPGGTFNEPWGVAVGPDGAVYVADTWNHRVQKFTGDGEFVTAWGDFGQAENEYAFWGPRDVAVDAEGHVFVTDTGNKRVVVFDQNGKYLSSFGAAGIELGNLDEPVGVAVDKDGKVYVVDTWNQRVQIFAADPMIQDRLVYRAMMAFDVAGWYGQSLENKPYIDVSPAGDVFVTDPESYRVIQFTSDGQYVRSWGTYSAATDGFGLPAGVAVAADGRVWVSDGVNNRIMRFTMP